MDEPVHRTMVRRCGQSGLEERLCHEGLVFFTPLRRQPLGRVEALPGCARWQIRNDLEQGQFCQFGQHAAFRGKLVEAP
jgi:hypothetical protein